jgi:peptide-methionine (S)-S-oxide reductase
VLLGFCEGLNDQGTEFLLRLGAKADWERRPSSKYPDHSTPLLMACQTYVRGRNVAKHRLLDLLIAAGAKPQDDAVMTIHRGDARKLDALIKADPSLVGKDRQFKAMFDFADEPRLAYGTLLHIAIEHNEIECADVILSHYRSWNDTDINTRAQMLDGFGGHTPLFLAARSWMGAGYPTLQWIIQRVGQYIDTGVVATMRKDGRPIQQTVMEYAGERERKLLQPFDRVTQIRRAIEANDVATFTRMLDEHPDLASPRLWPTVIHRAKSLEMTRILLDRGVDPNACPAPRKPLHLAAYYSLADIIELLIERGADVNFLNPLGERPIDLVDAYEPRPIGDEQSRRSREALIRAGATYDIHAAVRTGDVELVRPMLDADPALVNTPQPWNPLFTAARAGRVEVAKLLLDCGANVNGTNDKGNTPLWFACQSPANAEDRLAVATLLLDRGARVNAICEDGSTALHFAAWRGPTGMVELLLSRGAKEWIGDKDNKKPIDYARNGGQSADKEKIIELLDRPVIRDAHFRAAVKAIQSGDLHTVKQLLADHPNLVHESAIEPECYATHGGYFTNPRLLWFVADNPNLIETMPANTAEITKAILDAGAELRDIEYTIELVATSRPAREQGFQRPLIKLLASGRRIATNGLAILGHRERDAMATMLESGTPLTAGIAAGMGYVEDLRKLLPAASPQQLHEAFSLAVINDELECARLCLDAGAEVNRLLACHAHSTAAHQAVANNNVPMLKLLVERGADLTIRDTLWNGTPPGWAPHTNSPEAAAFLRLLS